MVTSQGLALGPGADAVPGLGEVENLPEVWRLEEFAVGIGERDQWRGLCRIFSLVARRFWTFEHIPEIVDGKSGVLTEVAD